MKLSGLAAPGPPQAIRAAWGLPRWLLAAAVALIGLAWIGRALFLHYNEVGIDQMAFALMGQTILHGHLPYSAIFDNKPVGLYYIYAASEWLFGQRYYPLHVLSVLAPLLTAAILARTARLLSPAPGLVLAAVALYFGLSLADEGFFPTSELIACPAVTLGLHLGVRRALGRIPASRFWLFAGATLGLGAQISYLVIPIGGLVGLVCLVMEFRDGARTRAIAAFIGLSALGCGAAFGVVLVPQNLAGTIGGYFALQIQYHEAYANVTSLRETLAGFSRMWPIVLPVLFAGLLRLAIARIQPEAGTGHSLARADAVLAAGLVGALVSAGLSHRFYLHYFILLVPSVVLLTLAIGAARPGRLRELTWAAALLVGAGVSLLSAHRAITWRLTNPLDVQVSAYIRAHTAPAQKIFVYDESPALYYLSGRAPVTRIVFPSHYMRKPEADALGLTLPSYVRNALAAKPSLVIVGQLWLPESAFNIRPILRAADYHPEAVFKQREIDMFLRPREIEVYTPSVPAGHTRIAGR